jgi:RNA polymerase sigma-70 factor (ECF subfamily)
VKRYSKQVFAVCLGLLGNVHDAEDLSQEALIKGFTQMDQLRDTGQFGSWLLSIARNLCIDHLRRRKRGSEVLALRPVGQGGHSGDYTDLHEAIFKLPEKYRLPLVLYYFDGQSSTNVARALKISPAGVLTRLSRARRELRELLGSGEVTDES